MKATIYMMLNIMLAGTAFGSSVTYNSRTTFTAATSGLTTIDFGVAAPPPAGSFTAYPSGITLSC